MSAIVEVAELKRFCGFVLLLLGMAGGWAHGAGAAEPMKIDVYLRHVLSGNRALRAGIKSVEAAYYAVLSGVSVQRPQVAVSASGSWLSGQSTMGLPKIGRASCRERV